MRRYSFALFLLIALLLINCRKKGEEGGKIVIGESELIEVKIPQVRWEKSLVVTQPVVEGRFESDSAVAELLMDEIFSRVSRAGGLKVLNNSVGNDAEYVLECKLKGAGERIGVTYSLIDSENDSVVWSTTHEEDLESIMTISESVAEDVVRIVEPSGEKVYSESKNINRDLMKLYVEGRLQLNRHTRDGVENSVKIFKKVLQADSTFVPAYTALAQAYLEIIDKKWSRNNIWIELAQKAAKKAVEIDRESAEGYSMLGNVYLRWGDFKKADQCFRSGLEINQNLVDAWLGLGRVFINYGLYRPALDVYEKALSLDPLNMDVLRSRSMILIGLKRYNQVVNEVGEALKYNSGDESIHQILALAYYYLGDLKRAQKEIMIGSEGGGDVLSRAILAMIYAKRREYDRALEVIELEVKPDVHNNGSLATAVAAVYSLLGRTGLAVQWLEKAYQWGYREYVWLANDPNFDNIREDERFSSLMARIEEDWRRNVMSYKEVDVGN